MKPITYFLTIIVFSLVGINRLNAQYVTIPDPHFVTKLQQLVPNAMNGNQMDTAHNEIISSTSLDISNSYIQNLYGIQFFDALEFLYCQANQLSTLPTLPSTLIYLNCNNNFVSNWSILPNGLKDLFCASNYLSNLPLLPSNLVTLYCPGNQLTGFPVLPESLRQIDCSINPFTTFPDFPDSLQSLISHDCDLISLPVLPSELTILDVHSNQLTSLPDLPESLELLDCRFNQLTFLPNLPQSLLNLVCGDNQISCLPIFPFSLQNVSLENTLITCIPNETQTVNQLSTGLPICLLNDPVSNPNNCVSFASIYGVTYEDINSDCIQLNEDSLHFIPLLLKDNTSGDTIAKTYSWSNGVYGFTNLSGNYSVFIDTVALAAFVESTCTDSVFSVISGQFVADVNLGIRCNGGFDIGVQSVVEEDIVFPGEEHTLRVIAGDLSSWYGLHCGTSGLSGQVQITVTGPVTYNGIPLTALTPTVNGNVYTYDITDFSIVDIVESFALNFTTDTTAQSGDTVSVYVTVTTSQPGDGDLSNNTFSHAYLVVNSYDPNMKEVYPVDVLPGYDDYFTYTIHFQNMGSAPAINIRLADTLDSHLDFSTFEVLSFSHDNEVHLTGNNLMVRFPNINLVSNTVDEEASKGYIQYRIKPLANQPNGTVIPNTAYIYFDYNPAVITNTTENHFWEDLSVESPNEQPVFYLYPNPNNGKFTIHTEQEYLGSVLRIVDVSGKAIFQTQLMTTTQSVAAELGGGVYIVTMENPVTGTVAQKRLVVSK